MVSRCAPVLKLGGRSTPYRWGLSIPALALALASGEAHAGLRDDAHRVKGTWEKQGAEVTALPTRFVYQGESFVLEIAPNPDALCTTVAFVGARGLSFHARFGSHEDDGDDDGAVSSSSAGALSMSRCGSMGSGKISVSDDAGRGALEVVVGYSRKPLTLLREILPDRAPPVFALAAEPGVRPAPPRAEERARTVATRALRAGASSVDDESWPVSGDGSGAAVVSLDPGCHEFRLFAPDLPNGASGGGARLDVDAELWDEETGRLLSRDRSDALDASLSACVGAPLRATAIFAGAHFAETIAVAHASFALPPGLPWMWGAHVRGRMAAVLHARGVALEGAPVFIAQGGGATTRVPVRVPPGGCYVVVVTTLEGTAHSLSVRLASSGRESRDDGPGGSETAVAAAMCVASAHDLTAEVDARGVGVAWGLSVYRTRSGTWE